MVAEISAFDPLRPSTSSVAPGARKAAIVAAVLLATAGCDADSGVGAGADRLLDAARSGAEFRYDARRVHEAVATESCSELTPRRELVLARERAAVRAFGERVRSGSPGAHFAVARSDVQYLQESGKLGCWEDSDPRFAALHVQAARDAVRNLLREMDTLAPAVAPLPVSGGIDMAGASKFRWEVRELVQFLQPFCSVPAEHDPILAPSRAELAQLRQRLQGTPYALHFALAEADALYLRSITQVECADVPSGAPQQAKVVPQEESRRALEETRRRIRPLAAQAGVSTGS